LISDTKKLAETLARFNYEKEGKPFMRSKVLSRGEDTEVSKSTTAATRLSGSAYIYAKTAIDKETSARCQYVVGLDATLHADFGTNERLLDLLGFQPANWLPAIWEVVPWSWLLDYLTNISQILDACASSQAGISWIVKTTSVKTTQEVSCDVDQQATYQNGDVNDIVGSSNGTAGRFTQVRITMDRSLPESLSVPPLYFEMPSQLGQLGNMVAVLFKRRPESRDWLSHYPTI
jgi:hypothetical protein